MIQEWRKIKADANQKGKMYSWIVYKAHSMRVLAKHMPLETKTKEFWEGYNKALFELCTKILKGPKKK